MGKGIKVNPSNRKIIGVIKAMEKGEGKAVKKRRHKEFNNSDVSSNKGKGDSTLLVRKYKHGNILGQKSKKQANSP